jgi:hypothetical protein
MLRAGSIMMLLASYAGVANAEILSAVASDQVNPALREVTRSGNVTVAISDQRLTNRARTALGLNKIFNRANLGNTTDYYGNYATSIWTDLYTNTADSKSTITVSFRMSGRADFPFHPRFNDVDFNFYLSALKGDWRITSTNFLDDIDVSRAGRFKDQSGTFSYSLDFDPREVDAQQYATFRGAQFTELTKVGDTYEEQSFEDIHRRAVYRADRYELYEDLRLIETKVGAEALQLYREAELRHPVYANARLCAFVCQGVYNGRRVSLTFEVGAGEHFMLASALMAEDLQLGFIDFFNTIQLESIESSGGSLSSSSGELVRLASGGFGYASAIPEPGTWALMGGGFGIAGAVARRRGALRAA